jgi:hypothetical protein
VTPAAIMTHPLCPNAILMLALDRVGAYNNILTINQSYIMEKQSKKSRKAKQFYTLKDKNLNDVQIDLNNYRVICNKTHERKQFYHKYLFNLITRKYNGNIDIFRETYTSRTGDGAQARKIAQLQQSINRHLARVDELRAKLNTLQTN